MISLSANLVWRLFRSECVNKVYPTCYSSFLCLVLINDRGNGNYIMEADIDLFLYFLQMIEMEEQWNARKPPCDV